MKDNLSGRLVWVTVTAGLILFSCASCAKTPPKGATMPKKSQVYSAPSMKPSEKRFLAFFGKFIDLVNDGVNDKAEKMVLMPGVGQLNAIFGKITNIGWIQPGEEKVSPDMQCPAGHKSDRNNCFVYVFANSAFKSGFIGFRFKVNIEHGGKGTVIGYYEIDERTNEFKVHRIEMAVVKAGNTEAFSKLIANIKGQEFQNENK